MKHMVFGFFLAVQFLTRIPVPFQCPWNENTSRWAIRSYPFVGAILGTIITVVLVFLLSYLPLAIMALLTLSLWVWLTGGLHLDGWMDVADAVGSNAPLEKKWEIMKDPHVGSFGHLALYFLLAWKTVLLYGLLELDFPFYSIIFMMAFSRFGAVIFMIFLPPAKKQGLAWEWRKNVRRIDGLYAILPLLVGFCFFQDLLFFLPVFAIFYGLFGVWVMHAFKGTNGDLLGTAIEGGELWGLAFTWIYFSFVTG